MKKIKEIKSSKTQEGEDIEITQNQNSEGEISSIWPQEFEEQRSMNIRMNEQPLESSAKPKKKKNQK